MGPTPFAADGDRRWAFRVEGTVVSSPAVDAEGTVYVGVQIDQTPNRGRLYAIKRGGTPKWDHLRDFHFPTNDYVDAAPTIGPDGSVYFGSWDGVFYTLTSNGTRKPGFPVTIPGEAPFIVSSAALSSDGVIYVGVNDFDGLDEIGRMVALTPGGVILWERRFTGVPNSGAGEFNLSSGAIDSSPAVGADGSIYFGSFNGNVYALNRDGTDKWSFSTGARIRASPAIGPDGTVYIGSRSGAFYAINPQTGEPRRTWSLGSAVSATAAIGADGSIYIGTVGGVFYSLSPDAAAPNWTRAFAGFAINSSAAVRGDGTIIFGTNNSTRREGVLHALTPTGGTKWEYTRANDEITSSPVVDHDGFIYVGSLDRHLHAIEGSGSPLSRLSTWPSFRRDAQNSGRTLRRNSNSKLINLSTLALVGTNTNLIAGFSVDGVTQKSYLIRAVGPTLSGFGVPNPLGDPTVEVKVLGGPVRGFNDNWETQTVDFSPPAQAAPLVGAFPLQSGSKDAAVVPSLEPGRYTAQVGTADNGMGMALVEAYDARPDVDDSRLINLSTRGPVGPGVLIPGLVIRGAEPLQLLVRAVGPGLAGFGVPDVLERPSMSIVSGDAEIFANTGWSTGGYAYDLEVAARQAGAFPLAPNSADSAAIVWLGDGNHTFVVSGAGGTSGEVLVEVYILR